MQKVSLEGSGLTVGGVGLTSCRWEKGSVNDFSHSWPPFGNARDQLKSILSRHHLLLDLAIINIAVFILSRNHFWPLASLAPLKSWIWQLDKCRETIWSWRRHRYPCFARAPQIIIDDPSMSSSPFIMQSIIAIALLFFCFCVPFLLKMWVTIAEEVKGIIGNWRVS